MNILVSFSGGRTSAFMCKYMLANSKYNNKNLVFCFANTGKERKETLQFVNQCDKDFGLNLHWIEASVNPEKGIGTSYRKVTFETASRNGEPFEAIIKKYGLPSHYGKVCTRELKTVPIKKFAQDYFGTNHFLQAIGIRPDEAHRVSQDNSKIYPLIDSGLSFDSNFIRTFWATQQFDLKLKDYEGNCDLCFLKSKRKKLTLISENPAVADWWAEMESKHKNESADKFDMRSSLYITDLQKMAKRKFTKAIDKFESKNESLFDLDLDVEYSCTCSNT